MCPICRARRSGRITCGELVTKNSARVRASSAIPLSALATLGLPAWVTLLAFLIYEAEMTNLNWKPSSSRAHQ